MATPVKPRAGPPPAPHPTPAQLRAARALLGWSQADLARASGVSLRAVKNLELAPDVEPAPGRRATLARLVEALGGAGVTLSWGEGAIGVTRVVPGGANPPRRGREAEE